MKWILAFTVNTITQKATLINTDYEGSKTYKMAVKGWYRDLDGKPTSIRNSWDVWAIIEHEE